MARHRLPFLVALVCISLLIIAYVARLQRRSCTPADAACVVYRPHIQLAIITSYYKSEYPDRAAEIDVSLASLIANPLLHQVHVLVEVKDRPLPPFAIVNPRTKEIVISKRPLMGDYIQYACDHLHETGHRVIFSNSDIFFDSTLDYFTKIADEVFDQTFYAISRWRLDATGKDIDTGAPGTPLGMTAYPFPTYGSYDTFAFKPKTICSDKVKLKDMVESLNYTMGVLGAENRLLYEVRRQYPEIKLVNPYKDVRTVHIHDSGRRGSTWSDRVNE
ncbi:putative ATP-dependent RNA helicase ddx49, partial [Entomortierella chlamydospora]